jgi:hypothetical protein
MKQRAIRCRQPYRLQGKRNGANTAPRVHSLSQPRS